MTMLPPFASSVPSSPQVAGMVVVILWKAGLVKVIVTLVGFGLIRVSDVVAPPEQLMLGLG